MSVRIYIGGLSFNITDDSLRDAFNNYGEIVDATIIRERETGLSRGFGFVTFSDDVSAQSAIDDLDGSEYEGRTITISRSR
ncbi:RNA recognition motif domain-containing protein [Pseudomonas neuropathica]